MPSLLPSGAPLPRRAVTLFSAAATASLLAACSGGSLSEGGSEGGGGGDHAGPVKVGLALPLSGVYAPLGEDMTQGFELYLDEQGGKLGGHDVEVVEADTGDDPQVGVPATSKLVTQDQVSAVVGIVSSATALGVKDTFVQSEVPLIVANAGANDVTADASPYIWRTSFTNEDVAGALGAAVAEEVGDGGAYILAADYAAGKEMAAGFRESFEAAGGTVAGQSFTPFGTTSDWQPYLSKVRNSGADAVWCFYAGSEAVNFVKQYNSFGLAGNVPLYGTGFLTEGDVLSAQGGAAAGTRTSLHYSHTLDSERNKQFVTAYEDAYDEKPTVYAVQAYDAAAALDTALQKAEAVDGPGVADALGQVGEIDSPRGTWRFDENHDPDQPYYLREVRESDAGFANLVVRELDQQGG